MKSRQLLCQQLFPSATEVIKECFFQTEFRFFVVGLGCTFYLDFEIRSGFITSTPILGLISVFRRLLYSNWMPTSNLIETPGMCILLNKLIVVSQGLKLRFPGHQCD